MTRFLARIEPYTREFKPNMNLALPIMAGQVAHMLVALADNIMVGKLGAEQLAAVSLGNTLIFIAMSVGIGFSFAITPLVAEANGAGRYQNVKSVLSNGLVLCIVNSAILVISLFFSEPILSHLDQPPEVVALAIPYMRIVSLSLIPLMIFQSFKQFADGLSLTRYAMYATLVANVLNVLFNYVFIYGKLGFPRLEVEGAAYGTLLSRVIMTLLLIIILYRSPETREYFKGVFHISAHYIRRILNLGLPTALQMIFEVGLFTSAIFLSGILGTKYQAANQIALNLSSITFMVTVGLSITATIRVGNQLGLRDYKNLVRIARSIFLLAFLVDCVFAVIFFLGRFWLPSLYIEDDEVITIAAQMLLVASIFQISDGLQVVFLGALRGLQDVWIPSLVCLFSYGVIGFPVAYYLGDKSQLAGQGIWIGLLVGLTLSATLMYFRYRFLTAAKLK